MQPDLGFRCKIPVSQRSSDRKPPSEGLRRWVLSLLFKKVNGQSTSDWGKLVPEVSSVRCVQAQSDCSFFQHKRCRHRAGRPDGLRAADELKQASMGSADGGSWQRRQAICRAGFLPFWNLLVKLWALSLSNAFPINKIKQKCPGLRDERGVCWRRLQK